MPITPPLGVLEPKNFGFPSFSPGDTSMPKMIKIGEIRVLIYFDLPWNEPSIPSLSGVGSVMVRAGLFAGLQGFSLADCT